MEIDGFVHIGRQLPVGERRVRRTAAVHGRVVALIPEIRFELSCRGDSLYKSLECLAHAYATRDHVASGSAFVGVSQTLASQIVHAGMSSSCTRYQWQRSNNEM